MAPGDRSALVVRVHHLLDPVINVVEQGTELVTADLAPLGTVIILLYMPGGIPLMADLLRDLAELLLATFEPGVLRIYRVLTEAANYRLPVPQRRQRQASVPQVGRPLIDVLRSPLPRPRIGPHDQPAEHLQELAHRAPVPACRQQHGRIAAEHFVEHLVLTPLLLVRLHQAQVPIRRPGPRFSR